jgi:MFS family permease
MFLPQVVLAILASAAAPALSRRLGLPRVFRLGLAADLISMTLLAVSPLLTSTPLAAYAVLLVATAALGAGFGAAVMALNTLAERYFPSAADRAVLGMNVLLGTGTALAPVLVAAFLGLGAWWLLPALVAAALLGLLTASRCVSFHPAAKPGSDRGEAGADPGRPLSGHCRDAFGSTPLRCCSTASSKLSAATGRRCISFASAPYLRIGRRSR